MAWKNLKQRSLGDALLIDHEALQELDGVHGLIDWSRLEQLLINIHSSTRGEKAWPPLMMLKALLLQSWYKLSDPALEKQLAWISRSLSQITALSGVFVSSWKDVH